MIEVEKKFQPTEEQLEKLLADSEFVKEETLHDIYYDYPDYRLIKKDIRFRERNGSFELKIGKDSGVAKEIEKTQELKEYFQTPLEIKDFIDKNLKAFMEFKNNRKKYKKGDFVIDVDEMDFGYDLVEIELLVKDESEIKEAEERIINLAKEYDFEIKKIQAKRARYLEIFNKDLYKELYG